MQQEINLEENIAFHSEGISFSLPQSDIVRQWLQKTIEEEAGQLRQLNFIFCSDEYLHKINVEYLNHDTYTDVITFPYSDEHIEGDIFISIDRINENAETFGVSPVQELHRVMVHGTLHLLGFGDKTPEEKIRMTEKENEHLQKLTNG